MNLAGLHNKLIAAGIPIFGVSPGPPIRIDFAEGVTQQQQDDAVIILQNFDIITDRRLRTLVAIGNDIRGLSIPTKTAIWVEFLTLWESNQGVNRGELYIMQFFGASTTLPSADLVEAKVRSAAFYLQDNPTWLVNRVFQPGNLVVNIAGDEPV